jgi:CDP-paratose 2-epimerase
VRDALERELSGYRHEDLDIRDRDGVLRLFARLGTEIEVVVHCAGQPSHDWAASEPFTDFDVNAGGTLNLLEATRQSAPEAVFIFCSTNKVYGDSPNALPLYELETRYEIDPAHPYHDGIAEDLSIDETLHSVFGASKVAADVMVQEYGRYFGLRTTCFRGGTITGPQHAAAELHGFLAYVMRCALAGREYTIFGYKGKQVRDAIHSQDLVRAFDCVVREPRVGEVYNIGGGRQSNCSVLEAIALASEVTGRELQWRYDEKHRIGDHIWWVGSNAKFAEHYPTWRQEYDVRRILEELHAANLEHWRA